MDSLREINSKLRKNENSVENNGEMKYTYDGENLLERLKSIVRRRKENRERGSLTLHFNSGGFIARIEDNVIY